MGIVGAMMVAAWAYSLMRDSGKILLDAEMDAPLHKRFVKLWPLPATRSR